MALVSQGTCTGRGERENAIAPVAPATGIHGPSSPGVWLHRVPVAKAMKLAPHAASPSWRDVPIPRRTREFSEQKGRSMTVGDKPRTVVGGKPGAGVTGSTPAGAEAPRLKHALEQEKQFRLRR